MAGWLVWFGIAALLALALRNWRKFQPESNSRTWWIVSALILLTPVTALFLGFEFTGASSLPVPGLPEKPPGSTIMIFSALPWTLAGGLFGPLAGAGLGMLSGLVRGVWDTHSWFSILDLGLIGAIFSFSTRQQYRTFFFRLLRQPLFNVLCLTVIHALLFMIGAFIGLGVLHLFGGAATPDISIWLVLALMVVAAMAGCSIVGVAVERFAYRPLRTAPRIAPLISALGVSFFLQYSMQLLFGAQHRTYDTFLIAGGKLFEPVITWGPLEVSLLRLVIIVGTVVLMVLLWLLVARTRIGKAMRATSINAAAAASRLTRLSSTSW